MSEAVGTLLIFTLCYMFLMAEKGNRALVACAGGTAMVLFGTLDLELAFFRYIDWHTMTLLLSMMMMVAIASQSGLFEYTAIRAAQLVNGQPLPLLFLISALTAVGSAFLNNVTTVLLVAPMVIKVAKMLHLPAVPYLIAIIMASNIGGTATLIGDPPNLMIGQAVAHLTFNDFLLHLGPVVVIIFIVVMYGLGWWYKQDLKSSEKYQAELMKVNPHQYIASRPLLYKSLGVLFLTLLAFVIQPLIGVELTAIAMAGALLLLFVTYDEVTPEHVFQQVEWVTIFFFAGLFMLIGGLEEAGIIDELARALIYYTEGDVPKTSLLVLWVSGMLSGFVDNVPFVAAMIPIIQEFQSYGVQDLDPLWWALALGACLGGNATIIGSTANVIVAGMAHKANEGFTYMEFLKVGVPVVVLSFLISTVYLLGRYLLFY
ncbi:putative tyrosine transporter P-protein [Salsuginibacillus halophilus]|uniref:Putative tyrosine transporter P-protein n=1 Tax=Salsuginibacillus halophilus TaxID=517424 RepID=A0A2P8HFW5_9BACI|nr:ArsB/NhaD family transporter [Salsuginibacillus halophilus]PSL45118.1 putative tyrosine transporter P-protein [Salsuginibacillus halophilus]